MYINTFILTHYIFWKLDAFFYYTFNDEELNKIITLKPVIIEKLKEILPPIKVKIHGHDIIKIIKENAF